MDQFDDAGNDKDDDGGFRIDLISSLFGQQLAPAIFTKADQKTTIDNDNDNNSTSCPHPVFRGNVCARCGITNDGTITTIPFWYVYPNLSLSYSEINRLRDANLRSLLSRKKLHLVLDLDHTLVHTRVSWKLTPEDKKFLAKKRYGIDHNLPEAGGAELYKMANGWTKLRPYVRTFLREASALFDMSIYTLGCRACGWAAAKVLDPEGSCFGMWRVIAREDVAGLDKHRKVLDVVPAHERVVVVVDDNVGVWGDQGRSVIKIVPYNFFSYDSPHEDKVHDASPPRKSWSQLNGDEDEQRGELARVLRMLRDVHSAFFDDEEVKGSEEYERRDVRDVLQRIVKAQRYSSNRKGRGNNKVKKKKK